MDDENELVALKKELKCWESMFARKYGKKPVKEDIDQSAPEIRDSYRRYTYLKYTKPNNNTEVKSTHIQPEKIKDDGVFSKSLNKKPKKPPEKISHFKKESSEWRPKLKPVKRDICDDSSDCVENNVVENEDLMNFQISTPDQTMVTPPTRRNSIRSSIRKNRSSSARFKNISQDLLNTCNDFLNRYEDTPLKKDNSDNINDPVSEQNHESVFSSETEYANSNTSFNSINVSERNTADCTVLKEINVMPNTFLPSENYEDDFSGVNVENSSNGSKVTSVEIDVFQSNNINNDPSSIANEQNQNITSETSDLHTYKNSVVNKKIEKSSDSLVLPTFKLSSPVDDAEDDIYQINHSNVSNFNVNNTNKRRSSSRNASKSEADKTIVTKYNEDEIPLNKFNENNTNKRRSLSRNASESEADKTIVTTYNEDEIPLNKLNSPTTKTTTTKTKLNNPVLYKADNIVQNVQETGDVFDFNVDSETNIENKEESISIPRTTKTTKARATRANKKKQTEVTQDEDQSDEADVVARTKRKREVDTEQAATDDNKKVKRRKNAKTEAKQKEAEENSDDSSSCKTPATKAGKGAEEIDKKSKKVTVSKKSAKTNKLVSENFVKIDIKKKTYVRGLKKMTGAQYKRKEWRKKTSLDRPMKNVSKTGKSICFKCGGEGHWAKFCKGPKKKVDPFTKLEEEKNSMEFDHLNEAGGSCFDYIEAGGKNGSCNKSGFTIDDVLKIEPCWPRYPYNTTEIQEADTLPLFETENGNPSPEACEKVSATLRTFGYKSFREGQLKSTSRIVSGLSTLVILATGSGKSLCYQLPAYMYYKAKKWITIVISPLVALMQDQVAGLPSCLPGACLNSNLTKLQKERVLKKLKDGDLAVLLVSPETLVSGGFGYGMLPPKSSLPPIAFACIDEAHCLSEWSHNFRPSYLKVCKVLQDRYNIKCLLGLTATASQATAKSVVHHLGITSEGSIIRDPHPVPQNLRITASRDDNRDQGLIQLLQIPPFAGCDSIIVYTTRRTEAERLASKLRTCLPEYVPTVKEEDEETEEKKKQKKKAAAKVKARKEPKPFWWNVECYHAGLTPAQRKRVQNEFMSGELRIVVATVAFGMGLDKSDVRSVIHYNMPKSFENYVQEIGRAGRDGKPSFCHVFLSEESGDLNEIRRHIYGNSIDRRTVEKFVDLAFPPCRCLELNKKNTASTENGNQDNLQNDNNPLKHFTNEDTCSGAFAFDDDTMQSLSDDEMEMLFSQQFDADVEGMESHMGSHMDVTENHIESPPDATALAVVDSEVTKNCEPITNQEHISEDISEEIKCKQFDEINSIDSETVKCKQFNEADFVCSNNSDSETVKCKQFNEADFVVCSNNSDSETVKGQQCMETESVECANNSSNTKSKENDYNINYCSGHRICISIDDTIAALDMPEENIATLMSYLELHPKKWLEVLNPLRSFCSVKCYGGPEQFQLMAKKFHPIALAVRNFIKDDARRFHDRREIDFNFGEVADLMCWDVITVAREVRSLQWNMDFALDAQLNTTGKSGIIVECENLSFHMVTAEGIYDDEKDEICDFLHESVLKHEETKLLQLDALYTVLRELSCEYYWQIKPEIRVDANVRKCIVDYFMSDEEGQLVILREMCGTKVEDAVPERRWCGVSNDIRTILVSNPDQTFTGRAIARIFHGIGTPCYPAIVYGRDRRFWRVYLDVDFNELRCFASKAINRLKGCNEK